MKCTFPARPVLFVITLLFSTIAVADTARDWLVKMVQAAHRLDYEGTFVYQHGPHIENMRILHKVVAGRVRERMISLSGPRREIIRDRNEVRCYLPDQHTVFAERLGINIKPFPDFVPEQVQDVVAHYALGLGPGDRVAGRETQLVVIAPKDAYRYGYHLWADRDTGLLLKASLFNSRGQQLEQFLFTSIHLGVKIPDAALRPGKSARALVWHHGSAPVNVPVNTQPHWVAYHLPDGFRLTMHMVRRSPIGNRPIEQLVYSDGLAAVSVFIEKWDRGVGPPIRGTHRMGAVHAMGTHVGDYQITVVGEVPAATVDMIGASVARLP